MTTYNDVLDAQKAAHDGDTSALEELLTDDFVWTSVSKSSLPNQSRGRAETLEWFRTHGANYESATAVLESPEAIVSEEISDIEGLGRIVVMILYRLRDGKISEMRHVRGEAA